MDEITSQEQAALAVLKSTKVNVLEAAMVAKEALEVGPGRIKRARKCIALGAAELQRQEKTVSFEKAVEAALAARKDRRPRTIWDFRYFARRFIKKCKGLAQRRVRAITSADCSHYIEIAFDTPRQKQKARTVLSGIFSTAQKKGWCSQNPVAGVEVPRVVEKRIEILQPLEIGRLIEAAKNYRGGRCLAAVGMMLYAGIRPFEVARLHWEQVDSEGCSIAILPQHSKTGGARLVTIYPPLQRLLASCATSTGRICPPQWQRHWRNLRHLAGFSHWVPDVLRHTFATYHLRHFHSYSELQYETGHRESSLLRTRYINMSQVQNAAAFWA